MEFVTEKEYKKLQILNIFSIILIVIGICGVGMAILGNIIAQLVINGKVFDFLIIAHWTLWGWLGVIPAFIPAFIGYIIKPDMSNKVVKRRDGII